MDGSLFIGKGDVILVGGNDHILGILQEVIGTQVADIVIGHATDGTAGVGIGHDLILKSDGIIQLVGMGLVVFLIEDGRDRPVAVVGQVRHAHIDLSTGSSGQGNVTLHIHTILERIVQILLIRVGQRDLHGDLGILATGYGNILTIDGTAGDRNDLNSTGQSVSLFGNGGLTGVGLGLTDALGQHIAAQIVGQRTGTEVVDGETHLIDAGLGSIVAQLQLGFVHGVAIGVIGGDVSGGVQGAEQVRKACALLPHCVRKAVGIQRDIRGGHHQLINHFIDLNVVIGNVGEVLHHILPQQNDHTRQVGASHGCTGQTVITAAGDGGENVAAMGGDLRLDVQAGSGAPGREVRNEGTGGLVLADGQLAITGSNQHLAVILRNGADSQLGITDVHLDITGDIVVNDDTGGTLSLGDHGLLFEGVGATANQGDLALHVQAGVVGTTANTGNDQIFHLLGVGAIQQIRDEILLNSSAGVGFDEVDDALAMEQIGSLLTVDGSNGHHTLVGGGRTNRTGIGVGSQTQVTVSLGAISGGIAVGGSHDHADTGFPDPIVNTADDLLVGLTTKAAGGT